MVLYCLRMMGEGVYIADLPPMEMDGIRSVPDLTVFSSVPLSADDLDEARRSFMSMAGRSALRIVQDRSYPRRLAVSSIEFIIVYLFLSLVVPDPIPMADEIIAAAAAAAIAWVLMRRADRESSLLSAFLEVLQEAAAEPHCIVSPNNKSHNMGS